MFPQSIGMSAFQTMILKMRLNAQQPIPTTQNRAWAQKDVFEAIEVISNGKEYDRQDARHQRVPVRVLNAISAQQEASEIPVGWVELTVVIFFGLLYAVSPKTFSREMTLEPVPWFVAVFLVVTLIRLYLAYRRRLSAQLLYLSVVIDMTLLLGMIWSFHLQ